MFSKGKHIKHEMPKDFNGDKMLSPDPKRSGNNSWLLSMYLFSFYPGHS